MLAINSLTCGHIPGGGCMQRRRQFAWRRIATPTRRDGPDPRCSRTTPRRDSTPGSWRSWCQSRSPWLVFGRKKGKCQANWVFWSFPNFSAQIFKMFTPTSYTNANLWFFETIFFKNAHWFYINFSRPAGATNQFWASFERSKFCYCRRILIFQEILNKISLNLSLNLGTFCKFLSVLYTYKSG